MRSLKLIICFARGVAQCECGLAANSDCLLGGGLTGLCCQVKFVASVKPAIKPA
ncbi:MAG: hypothetical protein LBQ66_10695 [Planctomycetaceae bacterium]|nr:hypothetical protein [Planctomycetaceae bacterium]